jgi:hypothetical protein
MGNTQQLYDHISLPDAMSKEDALTKRKRWRDEISREERIHCKNLIECFNGLVLSNPNDVHHQVRSKTHISTYTKVCAEEILKEKEYTSTFRETSYDYVMEVSRKL